jgi:hypothetical protein
MQPTTWERNINTKFKASQPFPLLYNKRAVYSEPLVYFLYEKCKSSAKLKELN